jgi:signal transduction histidine kinase
MTDEALVSALSRFVVEHLAQPVFVLDAAGNVVTANRAAGADAHSDLAATFRAEKRAPEIVAFVERLRATGQASLDTLGEWTGGAQAPFQLRGTAVEGFFVVTVEPRPKPAPRESEQRQLRRLDTLGLLTARVAHDINNLLTPLLLLSRELVTDLEAIGQNATVAQEIELTAQRAASLLQSLLGFVRPARARTELLTLNTAVTEMRPLLDVLAGPDVQITLSVDERPAKVQVDRVQLEQSLLNLVSNSVHAMPQGGTLHITVTHTRAHAGATNGSTAPTHAVLIVDDTGCGMTPEVQRRAFDAFFTTRAAAGGTGLGLSSVQHFVKEHAGVITLDSEAGRGTRIAIHLPAAE